MAAALNFAFAYLLVVDPRRGRTAHDDALTKPLPPAAHGEAGARQTNAEGEPRRATAAEEGQK